MFVMTKSADFARGLVDLLEKEIAPKADEIYQRIRRIGSDPLEGAPSRPNIPSIGQVQIGPNPDIEAAARQYSQRTGVPYTPVDQYVQVDVPRAQRIAREYDLMRHDPSNPEVARAYNQMIDETMGQYEDMLSAGFNPYFIRGQDPYAASPYLSLLDLAVNRQLGVFPTRSGFGTDEAFDVSGNPLLQETPFKISGEPALANDIFRAVHDFYGHGKSGVGFRAMGEENAYQAHAGMYSPLARRALASETRGQNSWLNYGPYGETNRTAGIDDTVFADQKTGLLPRWASEEGRITANDRRQRFFDSLRSGDTGFEGALNEDGSLSLVHYSRQPLDRVDPEKYGSGLSGRTIAERNRASDPNFVNRSYYGILANVDPYRREFGLGNVANEVRVDPELMYNFRGDPEKLNISTGNRVGDVTKYEKSIADQGYTGYYLNHPDIGKVAVVFDPYDVTKKFIIPMAVTGGVIEYGKQDKPKVTQEKI